MDVKHSLTETKLIEAWRRMAKSKPKAKSAERSLLPDGVRLPVPSQVEINVNRLKLDKQFPQSDAVNEATSDERSASGSSSHITLRLPPLKELIRKKPWQIEKPVKIIPKIDIEEPALEEVPTFVAPPSLCVHLPMINFANEGKLISGYTNFKRYEPFASTIEKNRRKEIFVQGTKCRSKLKRTSSKQLQLKLSHF